jgi:hypothetical protein
MLKIQRLMAAAALSLSFFPGMATGAAAESLDFSFNGARFNSGIIPGLPIPMGADVQVQTPLAGKSLFALVRLAGGFETRRILRDGNDGSPIASPLSFDAGDQEQWFHWPNLQLDAGLVYRLPAVLRSGIPSRLEFFGLARGRYEDNSPSLSTAIFPDAQGLASLSILAGAGFSTLRTTPGRAIEGISAELSAEYAPAALDFVSGTDFWRLSGKLKGFLPILSLGNRESPLASLYAGGFLYGDIAGGENIPLYVLTCFGGRKLRSGLGDSIRGYQSWGYEATTKLAANTDLRLVGPALFGLAKLRPLAYLFADAGWFDGLDRLPSSFADHGGFLSSAGAGAAIDLFGFAQIGARAGLAMPLDDPLAAVYDVEGPRFFWDVLFDLHF